MSGRAPFQKRVVTPAVVILATVGGLFLGGMKLLGTGDSSEPTPVSSASVQPSGSSTPTDIPSVNPSTIPSDATSEPAQVEALPVLVLNGTSTAGLAKTTAENIKKLGWTIAEVGNWSGKTIQKSVVYYPKGYEDLATSLAESVDAEAERADSDLRQDVLTLVVVQ